MSLKNILKKATLITAVSLGPMAKADTLSSESVDFLNQGKTGAAWTERIKLETPKNAYRITKVGSIQADSFKKADINQTYDLFGNTALGLAVMNGKAITLLKKYGADTNIKNEWGRTPDETYREGLNNMAKNSKGNIK